MYLLALAGCAPKTTPSPLPAPGDPCLLATTPAPPLDTFTVALAERVEPSHMARPVNDSERLLFRELYPGLVRLDCRNQVRPDLATEWTVGSTEHVWTFGLGEGAPLSDGSALTAAGLLRSWRARWPELQDLGVDSASAPDEKTLVVRLRGLPGDSLQLFADPAFSAVPPEAPASASTGRLTVPRSSRPFVEFITSVRGDLRDELDAGADLVVTRDPAVIEYAAQRPELETFPLPWSRSYVLAQPAGALPLGAGFHDESFRRSLAEEAVRADARPTGRPFWWYGPCSTLTSMKVIIPTAARVVYPQEDPVARQLAERIVALAPDSARLTALGLDSARFAAARAKGADRAYIMSIPFQPISPCREAARLTRARSITPLIDTRARAIVRRGSPPLTVDWDGTVRLAKGLSPLPESQP